MRVLITASRTWTDRDSIWHQLDNAQQQCPAGDAFVVIHGGARGGDHHAADWVTNRSLTNRTIRAEVHPADWHRYGRRAGMVRNADMVRSGADRCLAFIRDQSPGATACADMAQRAGIPTTVHTWDDIQKGHH